MRYYLVTAKCGHVNPNYYMPITFPVKAENGKEAALKARWFKRVKHHHPDAILGLRQVSIEEYYEQVEINNNDPYLHFTSIQQQNACWDLIKDRVCIDEYQLQRHALKKRSRKPNFLYQSQKYGWNEKYN